MSAAREQPARSRPRSAGGRSSRLARSDRPLIAVALALLIAHTGLFMAKWRSERDAPAAPPNVPSLRIDPNTATAAELELLPGVGPAVARNIIAHRDDATLGRAFNSPDDLDAVRRIGPGTVARLAPYLTFEALATGSGEVRP